MISISNFFRGKIGKFAGKSVSIRYSSDWRLVKERADSGCEDCILARDVFIRRIKKYVGAYGEFDSFSAVFFFPKFYNCIDSHNFFYLFFFNFFFLIFCFEVLLSH